MEKESPYFCVANQVEIDSLNHLLDLAKKKLYWEPGSPYEPGITTSESVVQSSYVLTERGPHQTSGLFRGQAQDWALIPKSYRDIDDDRREETSEIILKFRYEHDNPQLNTFCELAAQQNSDFPRSPIEQMVIAQHYGIKTPLLDWTTNIFVAIYFALDIRNEDVDEKNLKPFIYHITDERFFRLNIGSEEKIELVKESALVTPKPLDRRVERQFSVFSFHPHPSLKPRRIPVDEYRISDRLFMDLWKLMEGMGFSSSHYFPDYSGLAERIKQGFVL
jgi:hypothetical protein